MFALLVGVFFVASADEQVSSKEVETMETVLLAVFVILCILTVSALVYSSIVANVQPVHEQVSNVTLYEMPKGDTFNQKVEVESQVEALNAIEEQKVTGIMVSPELLRFQEGPNQQKEEVATVLTN
jgi:hypothetical protein